MPPPTNYTRPGIVVPNVNGPSPPSDNPSGGQDLRNVIAYRLRPQYLATVNLSERLRLHVTTVSRRAHACTVTLVRNGLPVIVVSSWRFTVLDFPPLDALSIVRAVSSAFVRPRPIWAMHTSEATPSIYICGFS